MTRAQRRTLEAVKAGKSPTLAGRAPKDGEWFVCKGRFGYSIHQAIRVTAALIFYRYETNGRDHRARQDEIVFSGGKASAEKLAAQLTSSRAQYDHECRTAHERKEKRNAELIEAARQALNASLSPPLDWKQDQAETSCLPRSPAEREGQQ
jgi:hypothetical protein